MLTLRFTETHNMVVFLEKPTESAGFEQIIDFLNASYISYALTVNPAIYTLCVKQFWTTAKVKTVNGEVHIHVLMDGKKVIITQTIMRIDLQLEDIEGVDCLPNAAIFEQLELIGAPTDIVADEAVYEERDDSLEKATTSATSLDAEQDKGNISKTQSKATPNEPSAQGTSSGGGPRPQDTMGGTSARTRFERVSKRSNNPLLSGRYGDDLVFDTGVLDGEEVFATASVVEKEVSTANPVTTVGEVVTIAGVEVSAVSTTPIIVAATTTIIPISAAATTTTISVSVAPVITEFEINLAQALAELKTAKPKDKGFVFKEPVESTTTTPIPSKIKDKGKAKMIEPGKPLKKKDYIMFDVESKLVVQLLEKRKKHFAASRAQEKRNKPPTKTQKRNIMSTYLKHMGGYKHTQLKNKSFEEIQMLFEKEMKRVNTFVDMNTELVKGSETRAEGSETRAEESSK
ncbi:hypothetical protein Tco_0382054 [Tanacetum coccineum]